MARLRPALSITQYAGLFAGLTLVMFAIFGGLTYHEVQQVRADLAMSNATLAQQEIRRGGDHVLNYARRVTEGFAAWEEVRQQLDTPHFYAYWRSVRMRSSQVLPREVLDADVYDAAGHVLAPSSDSTLPARLQELPAKPALEFSGEEPTLILTSPVLRDDRSGQVHGHVAVRMRFLPLLRLHSYRFVDAPSLRVVLPPGKAVEIDDLGSVIEFELRDNPMSSAVEEILTDAMVRLGAIIGVLSLLFYPLLVYLIGKPLCALTQHIDRLKEARGGLLMEPTDTLVPVAEVEKIRKSLNDYHEKLLDVHSSLDEKNKQLWKLAHHDALTGVMNRRAFDEYWRNVSELLGDLRFGVCLVLFDVNHFKAINDSYGHQTGDRVLKAIAGCVQSVLRRGEQLYRLGGDEFAAVLIDCDRKDALRMADRCQQAIAAYPFHRIGTREPIRVSIGLAHAATTASEALQALHWQADVAMYHAKRPGRSHVAMYTDEMAESTQGVFSNWVNNAVFEAITHGVGLTMFYQPVVNLADSTVTYYEALLRIRHGDEWILPSNIFPVVEARRLEVDLDRAIFRRILQDVRERRLPPGCGISLNLSGPTLSNPQVKDWLEPFRSHMDAHRFILEITETALITHLGVANEVLDQLRLMGFEVALDDFGSGYSSVRYLASMPVDVVKFDISLIRLLANDTQRSIVLHMARMILESGYKLVAEGIESEEQLAQVREAGFAFGQGFLFGRPQEMVKALPPDRLHNTRS